jgi:hypothetical protein
VVKHTIPLNARILLGLLMDSPKKMAVEGMEGMRKTIP